MGGFREYCFYNNVFVFGTRVSVRLHLIVFLQSWGIYFIIIIIYRDEWFFDNWGFFHKSKIFC